MSARPKASQRAIGWSRALGFSVGLHGLIVLGLVFAGGDAPAKPLQHAIVAELVAKGEEQKKKELPRRVRTTKKRPGPKRAKRPVPKRASKATERSADEALKRLEALAAGEEADEALARLGQQEQTGDDPKDAKGKKEGSEQGTLSQGELTQLQNSYLSLVGQAIKADGNYRISDTISAAERVRLVAVLFLRIGAQGQLLEVRLESSSGHDQFDRDIVSAARSARYPAPPKALAVRVAAGVRGTFRP